MFQEIWFRGLDEKTKKEFEATLKHNAVIRKLVEIITKFERENTPRKTDYEKPAWAYYQADKNGYLRACSEIKKLLLDQSKENSND